MKMLANCTLQLEVLWAGYWEKPQSACRRVFKLIYLIGNRTKKNTDTDNLKNAKYRTW